MQKIANQDLGRISVDEFKHIQKIPIIVVLDNVRSMNNVGSIFRSSDAFAIAEICLCGITPQPPHREIEKTALGATSSVTWSYFSTSKACIDYITKQKGATMCIVEQTTQSKSLQHFEYDFRKPIALVFGNELQGVSEDFLTHTDLSIVIDQYGTKHSLNIAVSVGIVLWHLANKISMA